MKGATRKGGSQAWEKERAEPRASEPAPPSDLPPTQGPALLTGRAAGGGWDWIEVLA